MAETQGLKSGSKPLPAAKDAWFSVAFPPERASYYHGLTLTEDQAATRLLKLVQGDEVGKDKKIQGLLESQDSGVKVRKFVTEQSPQDCSYYFSPNTPRLKQLLSTFNPFSTRCPVIGDRWHSNVLYLASTKAMAEGDDNAFRELSKIYQSHTGYPADAGRSAYELSRRYNAYLGVSGKSDLSSLQANYISDVGLTQLRPPGPGEAFLLHLNYAIRTKDLGTIKNLYEKYPDQFKQDFPKAIDSVFLRDSSLGETKQFNDLLLSRKRIEANVSPFLFDDKSDLRQKSNRITDFFIDKGFITQADDPVSRALSLSNYPLANHLFDKGFKWDAEKFIHQADFKKRSNAPLSLPFAYWVQERGYDLHKNDYSLTRDVVSRGVERRDISTLEFLIRSGANKPELLGELLKETLRRDDPSSDAQVSLLFKYGAPVDAETIQLAKQSRHDGGRALLREVAVEATALGAKVTAPAPGLR